MLTILSLWYPIYAAIAGAVYIVGREVYAYGYRASGAGGRLVGAIILDIALVGCFLTNVYLAVKHTGVLEQYLA